MRSTRRLLELRSATLVAVLACTTTAAAVSCASTQVDPPRPPESIDDASAEAASSPEDAAIDTLPARDAGPIDASPLPVVCESHPCATSLSTTMPGSSYPPVEGYCALLDDGTVACWGANQGGRLGRGEDGGTADSAKPARVVGLADVVDLDHTCARDKSGSVWCWGEGPFLRNDAGTVSSELTPVKLPVPPARAIGVSDSVGCVAVEDGVLCWGTNVNAQVQPSVEWSALPPTLTALPPGAPVRDVVVADATFVLREDGTTLSWGGTPPMARVSSLSPDPYPAPVVIAGISSLDATGTEACAAAGGTGYSWGSIGAAAEWDAPSKRIHALPEPVVAPEPLVQIATTRRMVGTDAMYPQRWCAVGVSGAVYCRGTNANGQAGDGTKDYAFTAVKVGLPGPAVQVKTMPISTCALLTSGKVFCWGNNLYGQLGNGTIKGQSLVPQEVVLP
jgi:Regulator of chromosome condensation (RCC1) repeat